ncbi:YkgJ family cysteine cluster protein [Undibacterium sp.]|uniref:YkgJ family cysteine cluster protein n=1 Tax=Undibacterium sp. TaxID=1914977 RepID=UPI0039C985CD
MNKILLQESAASGNIPSEANPAVRPALECRPGCGACCIAPSISSPIPGMSAGKPANVRCIQLTDTNQCTIFGHPERPKCCSGLQPSVEMCGTSRDNAMIWLTRLEAATAP